MVAKCCKCGRELNDYLGAYKYDNDESNNSHNIVCGDCLLASSFSWIPVTATMDNYYTHSYYTSTGGVRILAIEE